MGEANFRGYETRAHTPGSAELQNFPSKRLSEITGIRDGEKRMSLMFDGCLTALITPFPQR